MGVHVCMVAGGSGECILYVFNGNMHLYSRLASPTVLWSLHTVWIRIGHGRIGWVPSCMRSCVFILLANKFHFQSFTGQFMTFLWLCPYNKYYYLSLLMRFSLFFFLFLICFISFVVTHCIHECHHLICCLHFQFAFYSFRFIDPRAVASSLWKFRLLYVWCHTILYITFIQSCRENNNKRNVEFKFDATKQTNERREKTKKNRWCCRNRQIVMCLFASGHIRAGQIFIRIHFSEIRILGVILRHFAHGTIGPFFRNFVWGLRTPLPPGWVFRRCLNIMVEFSAEIQGIFKQIFHTFYGSKLAKTVRAKPMVKFLKMTLRIQISRK